MNFLRKMEMKFGKYAIHGLTMYIIVTYIVGYILLFMQRSESYSSILSILTLSPVMILKGQIWRLVSWVLIPPTSLSLWTIIMLLFYYQIGTQLERTWGDFLYNIYIFFGLVMTVIGSFILYFVTGLDPAMIGVTYSTYYVSLSIFLGFAMTYPDMKVLFMLFLPVKIKYLALVDIAYLLYRIITMFRFGPAFGLPTLVMILCSLASTILFFILTRMKNSRRPFTRRKGGFSGRSGQSFFGKTKKESFEPIRPTASEGKKNFKPGPIEGGFGYRLPDGRIARHCCAVCKRTELDDPNLEFRFCSKCNGNYEYCQDHLFSHEHVQ